MKLEKLNNSLRLLMIPKKETDISSILLLFRTGSRFEPDNIAGISHFVEHMFYKGTKKRPTTLELGNATDAIGVAENAFTSKEFTGYYMKFPYRHFNKALEIMIDILNNSLFDHKEIEKEKKVIIHEINMHEDRDIQKTSIMFEELLYKGNYLGRDIAGTKKSVKGINREKIIDYIKNNYNNEKAIVCISGKIKNENNIKNTITKNIDFGSSNNRYNLQPVKLNQNKPKIIFKIKKTEQTHLGLGFPAYSTIDNKKYILKVLSTILGADSIVGGSMSSRLFTEIRAKRGMAYYIGTETQEYLDTGNIYVQAGIDHKKVNFVFNLIIKEFKKLKEKKVSLSELKKAKEFLKGRLAIALDDSFLQSEYYGLQQLLENKIIKTDELYEKIDKVSADEIQQIANELFIPKKLNVSVICPKKSENLLKNIKL